MTSYALSFPVISGGVHSALTIQLTGQLSVSRPLLALLTIYVCPTFLRQRRSVTATSPRHPEPKTVSRFPQGFCFFNQVSLPSLGTFHFLSNFDILAPSLLGFHIHSGFTLLDHNANGLCFHFASASQRDGHNLALTFVQNAFSPLLKSSALKWSPLATVL